MDKLQREYDRFGPWVTEIKEEDDVPEQFGDYKEAILMSNYCFKIPVAAERRDLKPGMVLYQTVVSVKANLLQVLSLKDSSITCQEVDLKHLQFFQCAKAILLGELNLVASDTSSTITYNPVESEPIEKLESLIRDRYCDHEQMVNIDEIVEQDHVQSFLYETLLAGEAKKERLKIVAYQPSISLDAGHIPIMRRWREVAEEFVLKDTVFLTNGSELIVISRMKDLKNVQQSDHGYRYTYIPLCNIRTLLLEPEEKAKGVLSLSIVTENSRVVFKVDKNFRVNSFRETLKI